MTQSSGDLCWFIDHIENNIKMIDIETFVYFDLESTGLMKTRPKITELSCIAVSQMGLSGNNILHK